MWWYDSPEVISDCRTVHCGHDDGMTLSTAGSGDAVIVSACSSDDEQQWIQEGD